MLVGQKHIQVSFKINTWSLGACNLTCLYTKHFLCIIFYTHSPNKLFVFLAFRMDYYHYRESRLAQICLHNKDSYCMFVFMMSFLQIYYHPFKMSGVLSAVFVFLVQLEINVFCNIILPYEKYRFYKSSKQSVSNFKG